MARKRSPIWRVDRNSFLHVLRNADSVTAALQIFGVDNVGAHYKTLRRRAREEEASHLYSALAKRGATEKRHQRKKRSLAELLNKGVRTNSNSLKNRLVAAGVLRDKCAGCGVGPEWQGNHLVLVLDHVNGEHTDNRISNLRILCPNCHSQTPTFAGRNRVTSEETLETVQTRIDQLGDRCVLAAEGAGSTPAPGATKQCAQCTSDFVPKQKNQKYCTSDCYRLARRKIARPSKEILAKLVWEEPRTQLATRFGVSDCMIEKWCMYMDIATPPRGYWAKASAAHIRPSAKELQKLTWELPKAELADKYGVSTSTVVRWWKELKICKPPPGYWNKKEQRY